MSNTTNNSDQTTKLGTIIGIISIVETLAFFTMLWLDRNRLQEVSYIKHLTYCILAVSVFFSGLGCMYKQSLWGFPLFVAAVLMLGAGHYSFGWF